MLEYYSLMQNQSLSAKDAKAAYMREYRIKNREAVLAGKLRWYYKTREAKRLAKNEYMRKYTAKNLDEIKERAKIFRLKNKESLANKSKKWRDANPEKCLSIKYKWVKSPSGRVSVRNTAHKRRAAKRGATATATKDELMALLKGSAKCFWCKVDFANESSKTIDHIIPLNLGGPHSASNCVACCRSCNARKANLMPEDFLKKFAHIYESSGEKFFQHPNG